MARQTLLYSASGVAQRASSIIFFPIFSYYLTAHDYGVVTITQRIAAVIALVFGLELVKASTRLLSEHIEDESHRGAVIGTLGLALFASSSIAALATHLLGPVLLRPFLQDVPYSPFMTWTVWTMPFLAVFQMFRVYLQATHQAARYVATDLLFFASNVGLNLLFVVRYDAGALGIIVSTFASALAFATLGAIGVARREPLSASRAVLRRGLAYSLPLVPFALLGLAIEVVDVFFLNAASGTGEVGVYSIAIVLGMFFSVIKESANAALMPWFFQNCERAPAASLNTVLTWVAAAIAVVAVGTSWFAYEALSLLSSRREFVEAWRYTPPVVSGLYFVFVGQLVNLSTYYSRTGVRYLTVSTVVGLAVNLALCAALVRPYGAYGAAGAKAAAFAVMAAVMAVISVRVSSFRFRYVTLASLSAAVVALTAVPYALAPSPVFTVIKAVAFLLLSAGVALAARRSLATHG